MESQLLKKTLNPLDRKITIKLKPKNRFFLSKESKV